MAEGENLKDKLNAIEDILIIDTANVNDNEPIPLSYDNGNIHLMASLTMADDDENGEGPELISRWQPDQEWQQVGYISCYLRVELRNLPLLQNG